MSSRLKWWLAAACLFFLSAADSQAAWNNVFQVTCRRCREAAPPRTSFFAPAPEACPQVTYRQRCSYQPYTTYRYETKYEPVTTYQKSYYWEPVTSYRYTSYYDPCTGCSQRVAQQVTSYQMRSKCNAVQSYVQRQQLVPVTAYRQSCYMEPVISYSPPPPCSTCGDNPPAMVEPSQVAPQGAVEGGEQPRGRVEESNEPQRLPRQNLPIDNGGMNRVLPPRSTTPRFDRTTSASPTLPMTQGVMTGTLVADDRITPRGQTRLVFASVQGGVRQTVVTDFSGRFDTTLPAGDYRIQIIEGNGSATFHSTVHLEPADLRNVLVVSRGN